MNPLEKLQEKVCIARRDAHYKDVYLGDAHVSDKWLTFDYL